MSTWKANFEETVLGVFLHDIGKFFQRADGATRALAEKIRAREPVLLPTDRRGGYTHKHVLWTEAFFEWLEDEGLSFPGNLNLGSVRNVAVYHHNPDSPIAWLCAEADRMASGMDRKPKDEEGEAREEGRQWDSFVRTALKSPFSGVDLGLGRPEPSEIPLGELTPGEALLPRRRVDTADYRGRYQTLTGKFREEFRRLTGIANRDVFFEGLYSLSERFLFAVPSSTMDEPDISLHDHSRAAAAIAGALYRWHEESDTLGDTAAIKDRSVPKFRFLAGDLSGIQSTLFRLANQQVRGVSKILRARSFLMGMLVEGASLLIRRRLKLGPFSVVQNAGGQFALLVPDTPAVEAAFDDLRREIERWMLERYLGELALNLTLGSPFAGGEMMRPKFPGVYAKLRAAIDEAKQHAFGTCLIGMGGVHRQADYSKGACSSCGVRPARQVEGEEVSRCAVCQDEFHLGGELPKMAAMSWSEDAAQRAHSVELFGQLRLCWHDEGWLMRPEHSSWDGPISAMRLWRGPETINAPLALRYLSSYVPRLKCGEPAPEVCLLLSEEAREVKPGEIKTFEHLALAALERAEDGGLRGEDFLMVLKADVDNLGFIFGSGLKEDATMSRFAALSRMTDFFFTGYLCHLLSQDFPDTNTVYAGGDDLLLIGPWRQTLQAALAIRQRFGEWTGNNPNITLSAGLELMKANQPLNRAARQAGDRLEDAKNHRRGERNRVSAIDPVPVRWEEFERQLEDGEWLEERLRTGVLSQAFVYRLLYFAEKRRLAEDPERPDLKEARWRAHWGYQLARNVLENKRLNPAQKKELVKRLNEMLGLDEALKRAGAEVASPRTAITVAAYRNRTHSKGES